MVKSRCERRIPHSCSCNHGTKPPDHFISSISKSSWDNKLAHTLEMRWFEWWSAYAMAFARRSQLDYFLFRVSRGQPWDSRLPLIYIAKKLCNLNYATKLRGSPWYLDRHCPTDWQPSFHPLDRPMRFNFETVIHIPLPAPWAINHAKRGIWH